MLWTDFASHIGHLPREEHGRVRDAFELGKKMHDGQTRKSGEPYYTHPITVATLLCQLGADADTIIAALLHDTIEDTPLTLDEIEKQFSAKVAMLVEGVTKLQAADVSNKPTANEQIETVRKIFTLMEKDIRIMVIKLYDRLHNMRTIDSLKPEKQLALAHETNDVYVKIADRLCMQDLRDELEGLCLSVLEPEVFTQLRRMKEQNDALGDGVLSRISAIMSAYYPARGISLRYEKEANSWKHIRRLMQSQGAATGLTLVNALFICDSLEDCYRTLGMLHQIWKREVGSFQDYINAPLLNGYRGLHTTIILKDGTRVRCKIRTNEMQLYSRRGIATLCFAGPSPRLLEALPWTNRISPLSEDTVDRSADFWQSLQSDILGESMTIHGPGDETVQVPKGATALDGLFYLFGDEALFASRVLVNGREASFIAPLSHSDTVSMMLAEQRTLDRSWLSWVKTGFAMASIRSALADKSTEERFSTGHAMLQQSLTEKQLGFIEEFDPSTLDSRATGLGYATMGDVLIAIADGHLQPTAVIAAIFQKTKKDGPRSIRVRFGYMSATDTLPAPIAEVQQQFKNSIADVRLRYSPSTSAGNANVLVRMTSAECQKFLDKLEAAGASDLHSDEGLSPIGFLAALIVLILAWGADPVIATLVLHMGVQPSDLSLLRLWSVGLFTGLLAVFSNRSRNLTRIPLSHVSLWIAASALVLVSFLTYTALTLTTPGEYNTIIRANTVLIATPMLLQTGLYGRFGICWLFTIAGFVLLGVEGGDAGLLLSLLALLSFSLYTFASSSFQRNARVQARRSQFLLATNIIAGVLSLPLLVIFGLHSITLSQLLASFGFILCCVGIPYYTFDFLTNRLGYLAMSRYINLSLLVTLLLQTVVLGISTSIPVMLAAVCMIAGNMMSTLNQYPNGD